MYNNNQNANFMEMYRGQLAELQKSYNNELNRISQQFNPSNFYGQNQGQMPMQQPVSGQYPNQNGQVPVQQPVQPVQMTPVQQTATDPNIQVQVSNEVRMLGLLGEISKSLSEIKDRLPAIGEDSTKEAVSSETVSSEEKKTVTKK